MNKFILTDIYGRNIYATPTGIRTGFRANEPVRGEKITYRTFDEKGRSVVKDVRVGVLDFENRQRGVPID